VDHLGPTNGQHAPAGAVRQLIIVDLERDHRAVAAADILESGAVRNTIEPSTSR
jgi:hypothetical protein